MTVNGSDVLWGEGLTLAALLEREGYDPALVAVMRNGRIAPRERFGALTLERDDALEVVSFVGGG